MTIAQAIPNVYDTFTANAVDDQIQPNAEHASPNNDSPPALTPENHHEATDTVTVSDLQRSDAVEHTTAPLYTQSAEALMF